MSGFCHNAIFVHSKKEVPQQEHYAILIFSSIHVPGDERSRQAPGHGYPAHSEPTIEYRAYLKKEDWEAAITEMEREKYSSKEYIATKINPAKTIVKVQVDIQE